jgi:predicted transposase/invertase (TIGR01784 family)
MRRDSLFYRLFQQSPTLLFDLLGNSPSDATSYRFESIAVKEPKFEIDGVFMPPEDAPGTVYFVEVQFQKDEVLYERLFSESFLYFYRQRPRFTDLQTVVIYPSRSTEQPITHPYRAFLNSDQFHRIYLDELGKPQDLPLNIGVLLLTTSTEAQAPEQARALITRAQQEIEASAHRQAIIDLITTIMVYRFTQMSRQEVEAMLATQLQETRFYQEVKEEGRQEGLQAGLAYQANLILKQLRNKLGELPSALVTVIRDLEFADLDRLGESIFVMDSFADVVCRLLIVVDLQTQQETICAEGLVKLAKAWLGKLDASMQAQLLALSVAQVRELASEVLAWQTQADWVNWLRNRAG